MGCFTRSLVMLTIIGAISASVENDWIDFRLVSTIKSSSTTDVPIEPSSTTEELTTDVPIEPSSTTEELTTEVPIEPSSTTEELTTEVLIEPSSTTEELTTDVPIEPSSTTEELTTDVPIEPSSTTEELTTEVPIEPSSTTEELTTEVLIEPSSTTEELTTEVPIEPSSTTEELTTEVPIEPSSTTEELTTEVPIEPSSTTEELTTEVPIEPSSTTEELTTEVPIEPSSTTEESTTEVSTPTPPFTIVPPFKCTRPGLFCSDCATSYYCDEKNNAKLAQKCVAPQTCNSGKCSAIPSHECAIGQLPFVCTTEGYFPDPVDCHKYYICIGKSGKPTEIQQTIPRSCASTYGYNPRTSYCDIKLKNDKCVKYLVPLCKEPGQTAALLENPSIYYVCLPYSETAFVKRLENHNYADTKVLYPFLYLCDNGKKYNSNYTCS